MHEVQKAFTKLVSVFQTAQVSLLNLWMFSLPLFLQLRDPKDIYCNSSGGKEVILAAYKLRRLEAK
ncbi:hypothetical protein C2125_16675 [Rahnella aquatilis]|jgi:hypothetical protein|nr:hypothetical protein C2125_16675 [Rahnella aquatilis]